MLFGRVRSLDGSLRRPAGYDSAANLGSLLSGGDSLITKSRVLFFAHDFYAHEEFRVRALILSFFVIGLCLSFAGARDVVADVHGSDPDRRSAEDAKNRRSLALLGMTNLKGATDLEE